MLEFSAQRAELLGRAHSINLDAAVVQIFHIARDAQAFSNPLREKAKSHALHHPGDNEPLSLKLLGHDTLPQNEGARFYQRILVPRAREMERRQRFLRHLLDEIIHFTNAGSTSSI